MTGSSDLIGTAVSLGVAYAVIGVAVVAVHAATRSLFLAVGALAGAGLTAGLTLGATSVTGIAGPVALVLAMLGAAAIGALLGPAVLAGRGERSWLIGFVVAAGIVEAFVAQTFGGRALRPDPLFPLPGLGPVATAVLVGVPTAAALALLLLRTRWGHRLRIAGSSPEAAERAGIRVLGIRSAAMGLAGGVSVLAAALAAPVVSIGAAQSAGLTVRGIAAVLLLGRASPLWALPGGLLLGVTEAAGQRVWPEAGGEVAVAALVILVMVVRGSEAARSWGRAW